jgi:hypothetical protein
MTTEGQDLKLSPQRFEAGRNFANKVWNAGRFLLMNLDGRNLQGIPSVSALQARELGFPEHWILDRAQAAVVAVTQSLEAFRFSEAVTAGKNILVSGATQAGKTTLLCALLNEVAKTHRIVTVEETFEIRIENADWVAMQTRQPNLEGVGEISLRRLVKEALRMRPGRIVVGEVREAESFDLLIALNSGLPGLCTIHANSAAGPRLLRCFCSYCPPGCFGRGWIPHWIGSFPIA